MELDTLELSYFEGIENEVGELRPVFISNACHVCKAMYNESSDADKASVHLSSCSGCRMIAYCGSVHQKQHWPQHREFCKAVQSILRKENNKSLFAGFSHYNISAEDWKTIRYNNMVRVEGALKRPMEPYEREMILYPRVCATCFTDDGANLSGCKDCHSIFYCCQEHAPKRHKEWCNDFKSLLSLNLEQSKNGQISCPLPSRILTRYEDLPTSLKEFMVTRMMGPLNVMGMGKNTYTLLTELASYPLTVLWALQQAAKSCLSAGLSSPEDMTSLVIHVVGAELPFECNNLAKWDVFLLNTLPKLKSLYITFNGPDLTNVPTGAWDEDLRCPYCVKLNKHFICDFQPSRFYHDYCQSPNYIRPDAIVAFNSGLYRRTGFEGSDSWSATLTYLLKEGVPLILTAYTAEEAPMDLERLQQACPDPLQVLLPPEKNPYRSFRPCRNFVSESESPLMFKNQYVTVVRRPVKS